MAGNPFEAPLDLALLARGLPGQICALPSAGLTPPPRLTSSSEEAERGVLAGTGTGRRLRWSRCITLLGSHRGRTCSAHTAGEGWLAQSLVSAAGWESISTNDSVSDKLGVITWNNNVILHIVTISKSCITYGLFVVFDQIKKKKGCVHIKVKVTTTP